MENNKWSKQDSQIIYIKVKKIGFSGLIYCPNWVFKIIELPEQEEVGWES